MTRKRAQPRMVAFVSGSPRSVFLRWRSTRLPDQVSETRWLHIPGSSIWAMQAGGVTIIDYFAMKESQG